MSRNHRNRSWRGHWVVDDVAGMPVARHRFGVVAMQMVDGTILIDGSRHAGTHEYVEGVFRSQAERLFAELSPDYEPDLGPAPGM